MARFSSSSSHCISFNGVYPIMVTPFHDDESLDLQSFERSIRFMTEKIGVPGVTVTGVLGESNRLTDKERSRLIETARFSTSGHLCVGTSHTGTAATVALCQMAQDLGADSVMVTPSVGHGVEELYHRIAYSCPDLPIVVQDHPSSTGVHISVDVLVWLATKFQL